MIQSGYTDWLGSSFAFVMFTFSMLFFIILILYIKLYVRVFYKGTYYQHYRLGKLLKESKDGGTVLLIPLIDRLEVFDEVPPDP
ncbi:MAG: hypothetical protein ACFFF9_07910 [Candidatus Thorarchaeota archaeon]